MFTITGETIQALAIKRKPFVKVQDLLIISYSAIRFCKFAFSAFSFASGASPPGFNLLGAGFGFPSSGLAAESSQRDRRSILLSLHIAPVS
jgi:hypothetical protein